MSELCRTPDGKLAIEVEWDGFFFIKKTLFVFSDDTVAARLGLPSEVEYCAKQGGAAIARDRVPLGGIFVQAVAGLIGEIRNDGDGMLGVIIVYLNPKGASGCAMVIGGRAEIAEIMNAIPPEKINKVSESETQTELGKQ